MTVDTNAPELMPCPFCGGTSVILRHLPADYMSWVSCRDCGLEAPTETGVNDEAAISYWNTREPHEAAVRKAREVKVRALVWEDFEGWGAKAKAMLLTSYLINKWSYGRFEISVSAPGYGTGFDGERFHLSMEAAKIAAQADYERRIREALE